jgi:hypothetical protein
MVKERIEERWKREAAIAINGKFLNLEPRTLDFEQPRTKEKIWKHV